MHRSSALLAPELYPCLLCQYLSLSLSLSLRSIAFFSFLLVLVFGIVVWLLSRKSLVAEEKVPGKTVESDEDKKKKCTKHRYSFVGKRFGFK